MAIANLVTLAPPVWPGRALRLQPGDLSQFAPMGFGFEGPFPIRPWDDPFGPSPGRFYAFQPHGGDPFRAAPTEDPAGGTVYLDDDASAEDIATLLRLLRVRRDLKDYAAFLAEAENPPEERFLVQLRIVTRFALAGIFHAEIEGEATPLSTQRLTIGELVWAFLEDQREVWGPGMSPQLRGTAGGDGDWAKEALAFGFMVENATYGVYRIWSRAWLVTK
jgi:hypothetical protein